MGQALPSQHPAVVLRSNYNHLRALLVIAMIAVIGLTVAVVILATNDDGATSASVATPVATPAQATPGQRADGGPDESSIAASVASQPAVVAPDESKVAAAIGSGLEPSPARPDESTVAASISGR
jgi:hypothetical protein